MHARLCAQLRCSSLRPRGTYACPRPAVGVTQRPITTSSPALRELRPMKGSYKDAFPRELFRVNSSEEVNLRDFAAQQALQRSSYDLSVNPKDGLVHPVDGVHFEKPNGASLRPNGPTFQETARNFRGRNVTIYRIPEGTPIPAGLVLYWEHSDHYSLQTSTPISLDALNDSINRFLRDKAEKMTKTEWLARYPFEDSI